LARTSATNARKGHYSVEDVETALTLLAFHCGNARKTSQALEAAGQPVRESTLKFWRSDRFAERYRQIENEELPRRYARIAERCESMADQAADMEEELLEQMPRQAPELSPRDTAGALRNVSVSKAVNLDKAALACGRPTEITATADVTELLRTASCLKGPMRSAKRRHRGTGAGRSA
jgi:hypothetical protein